MAHQDYRLDGVKIPSVTTILNIVHKEFLLRWYGVNGWEFCERVKKESGAIGRDVHDKIAEHLGLPLERAIDLNPRQMQMVALFKTWCKESGYKALAIEKHVVSKKYGYHGTLDSVGVFGDDETLFLMDWKTTSRIDDLYGSQIAAYAQAYEEQEGKKILYGGVVRLDKNETAKKQIEVKQFNNLDKYLTVFLACKTIFDFENPNYGKRK